MTLHLGCLFFFLFPISREISGSDGKRIVCLKTRTKHKAGYRFGPKLHTMPCLENFCPDFAMEFIMNHPKL